MSIEEITLVHEYIERCRIRLQFPMTSIRETLPRIKARVPIGGEVGMIVVIPARAGSWGVGEMSNGIIAILIGLARTDGPVSQKLSSTDREQLRALLAPSGKLGYSEEVALVFHNITWI
jgi:hypothetical protein